MLPFLCSAFHRNAALKYYYLIEPELNSKAAQFKYDTISGMDDGFAKGFETLG